MTERGGTLVLVRHGQSQWNLENRFIGWVDIPLTAAGKAEARRAGEMLSSIRFDHAFTSALSRAQETVRIILETINRRHVPIVRDEALNERHYGDLQGLNKDETAAAFGKEQVQLWRRSYDASPPGGESLKDTAQRTLLFYQACIKPLLLAGQNILVVAHGNSLRSLVVALEQIAPEDIPTLNIPTGIPLRYLVSRDGKVVKHASFGEQT